MKPATRSSFPSTRRFTRPTAFARSPRAFFWRCCGSDIGAVFGNCNTSSTSAWKSAWASGRIARELHDTLLQSFQGLVYEFQAARNLFSRRPEDAIKTLDSAIASADRAIAEGRDAIQDLRAGPAERRLEVLLNLAGRELRDAQDVSGRITAFQVTIEGQPRILSPLLQDEIYRIAQEVLRNAFQHARAGRIEAAIQYDPNLFRLRIRDDGKGIDPKVLQEGSRSGHFGLPGIRERAKRIGANLKLWSETGAGTEVEISIPARIAYGTVQRRTRMRLFRKAKVGL